MGTADQHQKTEATADKRRYTQMKIYEQEMTMPRPDLVLALSAFIGGFNRVLLVEVTGIEPVTSCMPCKRSPS